MRTAILCAMLKAVSQFVMLVSNLFMIVQMINDASLQIIQESNGVVR